MADHLRPRGSIPFLALLTIASLIGFTLPAPAQNSPPPPTPPTSQPTTQPSPAAIPYAPPPPVTGTVLDDRTGQPIPDFTVTYGEPAIPYWQHANARPFTAGQFTYTFPEFFPAKEFRILVRAKGYKDTPSRLIRHSEKDVKLEFRLTPPEPFAAQVRRPDGAPVAGATVRVITPGNALFVRNGAPAPDEPLPPGDERRTATTDAAGRFDVAVDCDRCRVVVLHDTGYAVLPAKEPARNAGAVSLQPWGTVACDVNLAGRPAAGVKVAANSRERQTGNLAGDAHIDFAAHAVTGPDGRATLAHMLPGKAVVGLFEPYDPGRRPNYWGTRLVRETPVDVPAARELPVHIGGGGATITGRLTADARDIPWKYAIARLSRAWPEGVRAPEPADWREGALMGRSIPVEIQPDGTFRATDVPPGDWRIDARVFADRPEPERLAYVGDVLKRFHVAPPDSPDSHVPPLDLGDVPTTFFKRLNPGDRAPDFEVTTLDGQRLRLADLRGKYVLIDFWATWCPPCRAEMPFLKDSWQALKNDPDVVILGLSVDATDAPVRPFVAQHGYNWTHAVLGEKSRIVDDYGVLYYPTTWLILPDGTLTPTRVDALPAQIAQHRQAAAGKKAR